MRMCMCMWMWMHEMHSNSYSYMYLHLDLHLHLNLELELELGICTAGRLVEMMIKVLKLSIGSKGHLYPHSKPIPNHIHIHWLRVANKRHSGPLWSGRKRLLGRLSRSLLSAVESPSGQQSESRFPFRDPRFAGLIFILWQRLLSMPTPARMPCICILKIFYPPNNPRLLVHKSCISVCTRQPLQREKLHILWA